MSRVLGWGCGRLRHLFVAEVAAVVVRVFVLVDPTVASSRAREDGAGVWPLDRAPQLPGGCGTWVPGASAISDTKMIGTSFIANPQLPGILTTTPIGTSYTVTS